MRTLDSLSTVSKDCLLQSCKNFAVTLVCHKVDIDEYEAATALIVFIIEIINSTNNNKISFFDLIAKFCECV